mgnify:CR=1 FL=1
MKKITIELDDQTFNWLEQLVWGLTKEEHEKDTTAFTEKLKSLTSDNDDLSVGIKELIEDVAQSLASGVQRSESWERSCLNSLTGYEGTYSPLLFDECNKDSAKQNGFKCTPFKK